MSLQAAQETRQENREIRTEQRERSAADVARERLREGDRMVTGAKAMLDELPTDAARQFEAELDAAWDDFAEEARPVAKGIESSPATDDIDAGWGADEEAPASHIREKETAKTALTPEDLERVSELAEEEMSTSFSGKMNPERLRAIFGTEEGKWKSLDIIGEKYNELVDAQQVSMQALETLIDITSLHPELRQELSNRLRSNIGEKYSKQIIEHPEFRARLTELQRSLQGRLGETGPFICSEQSLKNIIAIHETIGTRIHELIGAMDLKAFSPTLDYWDAGEVIQVLDTRLDQETDEFVGRVDVQLAFNEDDPSKIARSFTRKFVQDADGTRRISKTVKHDLFELSPSLQGGDIAKKITAASLEEYKRADIDAITLLANIQLGAYAWATYGYGWDMEKMPTRDTGPENDGISVQQIVRGAKEKVAAALREVEMDAAEHDAILARYDAFIENPEAVTPQMLANLGRGNALLYKGQSGRWYTKAKLDEALQYGEETYTNDEELAEMRRPFHAGKIGLIGNKWYGRIDLNKNGPQKGQNLKLLEARVQPSST